MVAERVLGRIRAEGALSALDFEPEHGAPKDWFGMPENVVRAVLEAYTVTGEIGLARRDGNRRYYDLLERLLPAEVLAREVPVREQLRHKLLSRYRAHGLLGAGARGTFDRESAPGAAGATSCVRSWSSSARSGPGSARPVRDRDGVAREVRRRRAAALALGGGHRRFGADRPGYGRMYRSEHCWR